MLTPPTHTAFNIPFDPQTILFVQILMYGMLEPLPTLLCFRGELNEPFPKLLYQPGFQGICGVDPAEGVDGLSLHPGPEHLSD